MNKVLLGLLLGTLRRLTTERRGLTPSVRRAVSWNHCRLDRQGVNRRNGRRILWRKVNSVPLGILFGLGVGALLAFIVAYMQHGYYLEIILPGSIVGMIVGYATQRYGMTPAPTR